MVQKNLKPQLIFIYSDDGAINATKYKNNNHIEKEAGEPLQIHSTKEAARVGLRNISSIDIDSNALQCPCTSLKLNPHCHDVLMKLYVLCVQMFLQLTQFLYQISVSIHLCIGISMHIYIVS